MELKVMSCCGLREIAGLARHYILGEEKISAQNMKDFVGQVFTNNGSSSYASLAATRFAVAIFTQAVVKGYGNVPYGELFKKFIEKERLGVVVANEWAVNPNTMNPIRVYAWTIHWERLAHWAQSEGLTKERAA